jgi:glutathione synthase/RimK-type ligase-like ATP-grasp enzyme
VSVKNPLLTHDDQIAVYYLQAKGCSVEPVIWGTPQGRLEFDALIVRSPWDYMDSENTRAGFFNWLAEIDRRGMRLLNSFPVLRWNLDKHYLIELNQAGVPIVPTEYIEVGVSLEVVDAAFERYGAIVVKPCIAAAAKDTFLIQDAVELTQIKQHLQTIRGLRSFMVQPFVDGIRTQGEWSLVFLNESYSHAVWKLPKPGGWLVQDELGGSVQSAHPPEEVLGCAEDAFAKLQQILFKRFGEKSRLLYARVDVLPGFRIGELELVEPELFFLDRRTNEPNIPALQKFAEGLQI